MQITIDIPEKVNNRIRSMLGHGYGLLNEDVKVIAKAIYNGQTQSKILRCKDCKHSFLHDNGERISRICGLTRMCGTTSDNWYCADAERREE